MQKWLDRWLIGPSSDIGLLSLLLLAVIMTADAVSRSAGFSLVGASEISGVLLASLIFFSIGNVQRSNGHVAIEAAVAYMPRKMRRIAEFLTLLACFVFSILISYGTAIEAFVSYKNMEYQYGTVQFPLWPINAIVTFGFIGLLIQQAVQLVQAFSVITGLTVDSKEEEYIPGSTV